MLEKKESDRANRYKFNLPTYLRHHKYLPILYRIGREKSFK